MEEEDTYIFYPAITEDNKLKTFTERYFTKYHNDDLNQYALLHSNKLFLVGISQDHPIVKGGKIDKISFDCINKDNTMDVKGKKKSIFIKN